MRKNTLTRAQVAVVTELSPRELDRLCADGEFPRPIPLGPWATGWAAEDVDAWLRARRGSSRGMG